jgi:hypothetical protein
MHNTKISIIIPLPGIWYISNKRKFMTKTMLGFKESKA